jgi:asparaginyl-tRNA synthetase
MKATDIKDLFLSPENNKEVKIEGWIRTIRDLKNFGFIEVNDGTCLKNVQVVFEKDLSNFEEVKKFSTGSAISVIGNLVLTPHQKESSMISQNRLAYR